jgi:hypothetical protein
LSSFNSEEKLKDHKTYCGAHKHVRMEMPTPYDNILQFKHYNHSLKVPFVAYADFECMLQKIQSCQPSDETAYTNAYQIHAPNIFVYYIKYCNGDYKPPVEYSGMDAPKAFYEKIKEDAMHIATEYYDKVILMLPLIGNEKIEFENKEECYRCLTANVRK